MKPGDLVKKIRSLEPRQQLALVASTLTVIVVTVGLFLFATRTTYTTLTTGLDPATTGDLTAALDKAGIPNRIESGGQAVSVPSSDISQARVAVAQAGITGGGKGHVGFELFDQTKLGATDMQQRVNYQRALEGEIARTIESIDGVQSAKVTLVLPKDKLFTEDGNAASASVLVDTGAAGLDPGQVRGVSRLVQSAVEGLQAKNITITDSSGTLLWPTGDADNGGSASKQAAESRAAQQMTARLNGVLASILGPGRAEVQVAVDLNVDKTSVEKLDYGRDKVELTTKKGKERLKGQGAGAQGVSGADGNIPTYGAAGGADGRTDYRNDTDESTYGVDKTVTHTEVAPGAVNRLDVALLVDKGVPAGDVAQLRAAVERASGLDTARGDRIAVSQVTFAKAAAPKANLTDHVGAYVPWAIAVIGALALLFFARRQLRRRENEAMDRPLWLSDLEAKARQLAATPAEPTSPSLPPLERVKSDDLQQVERLAEDDPAQLAEQIKAWMAGDG